MCLSHCCHWTDHEACDVEVGNKFNLIFSKNKLLMPRFSPPSFTFLVPSLAKFFPRKMESFLWKTCNTQELSQQKWKNVRANQTIARSSWSAAWGAGGSDGAEFQWSPSVCGKILGAHTCSCSCSLKNLQFSRNYLFFPFVFFCCTHLNGQIWHEGGMQQLFQCICPAHVAICIACYCHASTQVCCLHTAARYVAHSIEALCI